MYAYFSYRSAIQIIFVIKYYAQNTTTRIVRLLLTQFIAQLTRQKEATQKETI